MSNWYLRRSRRRFWARAGKSDASDADKNAAYETLYHVLETLVRLLAPFMPFVTEVMYQNLVREVRDEAPESVHHTSWPEVDENLLDPILTQQMNIVMELVSLGHAARNQAGLKVRQPLNEAVFAVGTPFEREVVERYAEVIADELNVKRVRLLDTASEAVEYRLHPLPMQLGQKHKSAFPKIRKALLDMEAEEAAADLLAGRSLQVRIEGGETVEVLPEEVEVHVKAHEGFSAASDGAYVAALDTLVTEELAQEGLAREFVRRVQDLRRQADLAVDARIDVEFAGEESLEVAVEAFRGYIMAETLTNQLSSRTPPQGRFTANYAIEGEELKLALSPSKDEK